jgi:hypothetical protein
MKMLKIILITIVGLALLSVISVAVDYYFYSWTSFVKPFGCEYKSIGVRKDNDKLEQEYDLVQIGNEIKINPNYTIESWYNEKRLFISRMFGDIRYNIHIEKYTSGNYKFTKSYFSNYNSNSPKPSSPHGEKPTTPTHYIKSNIYQMIEEMPLTDAQKDELKSKVQISCSPATKLAF